MTSNHHALYVLGDTRATMVGTKRRNGASRSKSHKADLSSDWSLQLDSMKLFSGLVHTARQTMRAGNT